MNESTTIPNLLTIDEVAEVSRRSPKAVRQLRANGRGPRFRKIDGRLLATEDDVAAWLLGDDS